MPRSSSKVRDMVPRMVHKSCEREFDNYCLFHLCRLICVKVCSRWVTGRPGIRKSAASKMVA